MPNNNNNIIRIAGILDLLASGNRLLNELINAAQLPQQNVNSLKTPNKRKNEKNKHTTAPLTLSPLNIKFRKRYRNSNNNNNIFTGAKRTLF